ncbi:MAG: ATP-dependent helicase [Schaedlerella sp.]|nr:ATP-dependent helicase [Schaedlerella sp.]
MLSIVDPKRQVEENSIIEELLFCIDGKQSLIFNAGAGAGKTYALVECLKHVCREKEKNLKYHNQKAICITYTNVAANEIKNRLGNTELILVSTIHERLWEIIKEYQEELVMIHLDNLREQVEKLQYEIEKNTVYSSLTGEQKDEISKLLVEKQKEFFSIYNLNAKEFRSQFGCIFPNFNAKISNVKEFSKTCSKIIRLEKYRKCICSIENAEKGYTEVRYDARSNRDYLHYMKISHDTVLMYSKQIICKYDELKRFIVDKYPYLFVDEYQDTSEIVVSILTEITNYSNEINHPIFVGYFGDSVQNIYDTGIGLRIEEYCKEYQHINKIYNRRSCNEIIMLANKIRNDDIEQQSVYQDSSGGSVKVFFGKEEDIDDFICANSLEMKEISTEDKTVHCFLLVNKIVAEHAGLAELYDWFSTTPFYKMNYDIIATELLSNDVNKLGEIERYLYNMTEFYLLSQVEDTPLLDIISKDLLISLDIETVAKIVATLKGMTATTLKQMLLALEMFKSEVSQILLEKKAKALVDKAIDAVTGIQNFSLNNFMAIVKQALFQNSDDAEEKVEMLLDMKMEILWRWYHYINMDYEDDIIYHTFHGTKGLEYDNVIMIFGDSFGQSRSYFNNYFVGYNCDLSEDELEKYRKGRNLLYVAATRARKNLRILYTGDYQGKKQIFDDIFGDVSVWEHQNSN